MKIYLFQCLLWVYACCFPKDESQKFDTRSLQLADFCENIIHLWELPKSWLSADIPTGETAILEVQALANTCVRKEEQSYLRQQSMIDIHKIQRIRILLLNANGVFLSECLKCWIWELWSCGLGFCLLPHAVSAPRVIADDAAKSALAAGLGILWAPSQVQQEMPVLWFLVGPQTPAWHISLSAFWQHWKVLACISLVGYCFSLDISCPYFKFLLSYFLAGTRHNSLVFLVQSVFVTSSEIGCFVEGHFLGILHP